LLGWVGAAQRFFACEPKACPKLTQTWRKTMTLKAWIIAIRLLIVILTFVLILLDTRKQ